MHQLETPGLQPVVNSQQNGDRAFFFKTIYWTVRGVPCGRLIAGVLPRRSRRVSELVS